MGEKSAVQTTSLEVQNEQDDVKHYLAKVAPAGYNTRLKEHTWLQNRDRSIIHFPLNQIRNRDPMIALYDETRVILRPSKDYKGDTHYIHASYVNGQEFILTQFPLKDTVVDFWRMVWQERVGIIVSLVEPNEIPGIKFLPGEKDTLKLARGRFKIISKGKESRVPTPEHEFAVREMTVERKEGQKEEPRNCTLLHYKDWKVNRLPEASILRFMELVLESSTVATQYLNRKQEPPILVLCANGAKKSGTFAALCMACKEYTQSGKILVEEIAGHVAGDRYGTLTLESHYSFLYTKLVEYAVYKKDLSINDERYKEFIQRMTPA